jgi:hypothetical protein
MIKGRIQIADGGVEVLFKGSASYSSQGDAVPAIEVLLYILAISIDSSLVSLTPLRHDL